MQRRRREDVLQLELEALRAEARAARAEAELLWRETDRARLEAQAEESQIPTLLRCQASSDAAASAAGVACRERPRGPRPLESAALYCGESAVEKGCLQRPAATCQPLAVFPPSAPAAAHAAASTPKGAQTAASAAAAVPKTPRSPGAAGGDRRIWQRLRDVAHVAVAEAARAEAEQWRQIAEQRGEEVKRLRHLRRCLAVDSDGTAASGNTRQCLDMQTVAVGAASDVRAAAVPQQSRARGTQQPSPSALIAALAGAERRREAYSGLSARARGCGRPGVAGPRSPRGKIVGDSRIKVGGVAACGGYMPAGVPLVRSARGPSPRAPPSPEATERHAWSAGARFSFDLSSHQRAEGMSCELAASADYDDFYGCGRSRAATVSGDVCSPTPTVYRSQSTPPRVIPPKSWLLETAPLVPDLTPDAVSPALGDARGVREESPMKARCTQYFNIASPPKQAGRQALVELEIAAAA
eukprot:TRINITY_DN5061_c0_g2_i1.p1 TRINITY_DN5061_c0_g2~~TRINITY_DN5061_c0_g2_i1.p1  ORF type:complete len:497 (-),score=98.01 TRINITY_DN5061_c0_g2_i1:78-1487(-)